VGDIELAAELRARGIYDERVLEAIASLNRSDFLPERFADESTGDYPLPIGFGQTISQPFIVAYMTQSLQLVGDERVLEIGTGSGYQTAVLALLCKEVYSVEIVPELAQAARERLERLGFKNVHLRQGDGHRGWPEAAPFDRLLVTAAPERIPEDLVDQLAPGGRLLTPVGPQIDGQQLVLIEKLPDGTHTVTHLLPVRFVPMTTAQHRV
jgi:protein-L-isoaspartate(D-aspartate) O-methyltransferase